MPANIEIKARVDDLPRLRALAARLSGAPGRRLQQEDTFFRVAQGRLKLRIESPPRGDLIYYERPDRTDPTPSRYRLTPTSDAPGLAAILGAALGVRGVVRKRRWLYRLGPTRLHLDEVDGLGAFLEFEYVLQPGEAPGAGRETVFRHMQTFGIGASVLVSEAYIDLLERRGLSGDGPGASTA